MNNKTSVKFSVIIPLYNKEKYIAKTINSVLEQTVHDFEVIVVDDGSTDKSTEIVSNILDTRIRLFKQSNRGVSAARNNGIRNSSGRYVCFLDADDVWSEDFLETVEKLYKKYPQAQIACPSYQINYGNRIRNPKWKGVTDDEDCLVLDFFEMATGPFWICNSSCFTIKKEALLHMDQQWFPECETVYEDFDLWLRLGALNLVAHSKKVCVTYNRITEKNARKDHVNKIVYSKTFMKTLDDFFKSDILTIKQKYYVSMIRDRRMVPYLFSLLLLKEKQSVRRKLRTWNPTKEYRSYKRMLALASYSPGWMISIVQRIRYQLF